MHPGLVTPRTPLPGETPAQTSAKNPLAAVAYVRDVGGPQLVPQVLALLPPGDLAALRVPPGAPTQLALTPSMWVPFHAQCHLLRAVDVVMGQGDLALLPEVGRFMAEHDIARFFRAVLRLGNPGWVMELSSRMWRTYHDRGRWTVDRTPVSVMCALYEHPEADEAFCLTFQGWMERALELGNARNVRVDHPVCVARGALRCVMDASWQGQDHWWRGWRGGGNPPPRPPTRPNVIVNL